VTRRGTCLYAFVLRWIAGDELRVCRSKSHRWVPHFQVRIGDEWWSFEPVDRVYGWKCIFHFCFKGEWVRDQVLEKREKHGSVH
jgi:hypothetical protein